MPPVLALSTPDTVVLGLVLFFALRGAFKGFVWQLFRTAGLVVGLLLAARYDVPVGRFLAERFAVVPNAGADLVGWATIVLGTFLVVTLLAHLVRNAVHQARLSGVDRLLGAGLGAVLGLLFAALGFTLWASTLSDAEKKDVLGGSTSTTYMAQMIDAVKPLFPEGIRLRWAPVLSALRS
ncbi:MAG: CvpA family protein [Planctomycetota bacterium]